MIRDDIKTLTRKQIVTFVSHNNLNLGLDPSNKDIKLHSVQTRDGVAFYFIQIEEDYFQIQSAFTKIENDGVKHLIHVGNVKFSRYNLYKLYDFISEFINGVDDKSRKEDDGDGSCIYCGKAVENIGDLCCKDCM